MPRRYSLAGDLGEAIRRGGAGFAGALEETARQKTEKEQFDQLFGLRTDAAGLARDRFEAGRSDADRTFDLSESRETRAGLLFDIEHPVGPQPAEPLTIADIEDQIAREAFELEGAKGFRSSQRRRFESERAPAKKKKVPKLTPLQLKGLVDERIGEQEKSFLSSRGYKSEADLTERIAAGLGQTRDAKFWSTEFGQQPDPDSTAYRQGQEFQELGDRAAILDSLLTGQLFPELGQGGQQVAGPQPPPNDGSLSADEYADFVRLWNEQNLQ